MFGKLLARLLTLVAALGPLACRLDAAAQEPDGPAVPILFDTDLGGFIDDTFTLGVLCSSKQFQLLGVTTVGSSGKLRAQIACRFLEGVGRKDVIVAWGRDPQPEMPLDGQSQYARHPAVIFGRTKQPVDKPAVDVLYEQLKARPGEITILATGPLTNVARLLEKHPDCRPWIKRIVFMGGRIYRDPVQSQDAEAEWNIRHDVQAAQRLLSSGAPLEMVPLESSRNLMLERNEFDRLSSAGTPLALHLLALYQLSDKPGPQLYDFAALWYAGQPTSPVEMTAVEVDDRGVTRQVEGRPNVKVHPQTPVTAAFFVRRVLAAEGEKLLPRDDTNDAQPVDRGGMPARVHVVENYDTDIERRWWLAGALEIFTAPPGGRRSCRAVLTTDFDDLMGDTRALYKAVVFNPVPGPPMGERTRLSFRYKMAGKQGPYPLRIQLYSLSKGYHRCLTLREPVQNRWTQVAVDLTKMRRPDGSGGPLSADERIDDIQFYTDPRAQLWIDDVVLYEAAEEQENRPFPRRIVFTAGFDTGKQGKEWPGDFEIVRHTPPRVWKAAQSVTRPDEGDAWIRVGMRGPRLLSAKTRVRFRYRKTGDAPLRLALVDSQTGQRCEARADALQQNQWAEVEVDFDLPPKTELRLADEVHFRLPKDEQFQLDDLLVYEPAQEEPARKR